MSNYTLLNKDEYLNEIEGELLQETEYNQIENDYYYGRYLLEKAFEKWLKEKEGNKENKIVKES